MNYSNRKTLEQRFLDKVLIIPFHECWEWIAHKSPSGYGYIGYKEKIIRAHRAAYELYIGKIPNGLCVCHKCDNPGCVRPDHLFLGTHRENMKDRNLKSRNTIWNKSKTHCKHGHEFTKENTLIRNKKHRACRICTNNIKRVARKHCKFGHHFKDGIPPRYNGVNRKCLECKIIKDNKKNDIQ